MWSLHKVMSLAACMLLAAYFILIAATAVAIAGTLLLVILLVVWLLMLLLLLLLMMILLLLIILLLLMMLLLFLPGSCLYSTFAVATAVAVTTHTVSAVAVTICKDITLILYIVILPCAPPDPTCVSFYNTMQMDCTRRTLQVICIPKG